MNKFLGIATQVLLTGSKILTGYAPMVESIAPRSTGVVSKVTSELTQISSVILNAETFQAVLTNHEITGIDKAKACAPLVAQILMQSELIAGKRIAADKQALFVQKSGELAGVLADLLNCLHEDNVKGKEIS